METSEFKEMQRGKVLQQVEGSAEYELFHQCLLIRLNEELDHHSSILIRERTDKMMDRGSVKYVIFDFKGINFMDSSGIGVIMGRYKRIVPMGGTVAVTNVGSSIDRILKLSGLYKIIKKYESNEDAMKSFGTIRS